MTDTYVHWLMLMNQLPARQDALRVRIWRRLQAVGAVLVRNACWCLPDTAQAREDFQWCVQEITAGGGEAMVCRSALVEGMTNDQVLGLFRAARDADYAAVATEAQTIADAVSAEDRDAVGRQAAKLRRSLDAIVAIDHGRAPGRRAAEQAVARVEQAAAARRGGVAALADLPRPGACRGKTWVTRADVRIDRLASAWLIQRHIDPKAKFRLVPGADAPRKAGELRFDMFEAEFTHRGDRCTFEVLLAWSGVRDPALERLAGIVHDLDLKDGRYQHPLTAGVACAVDGIRARFTRDADRITTATDLFDIFHAGLTAGPVLENTP